jgi:hypothetical protein
MTAARFQLAMDCGCDVAAMQESPTRLARYIVYDSLETQSVLTLAKMYDYKWSKDLTFFACQRDDLDLLKWLHAHRCPVDVERGSVEPVYSENIEMLEFLCSVTPQWSYKHLQELLYIAGRAQRFTSAQWLREVGAAWPDSFYLIASQHIRGVNACWSVAAVKWALSNGCSWGDWQCSKLNPESFACIASYDTRRRDGGQEYNEQFCECGDWYCMKRNAIDLFEWAHESGCPCTCAADAAAADVLNDQDD